MAASGNKPSKPVGVHTPSPWTAMGGPTRGTVAHPGGGSTLSHAHTHNRLQNVGGSVELLMILSYQPIWWYIILFSRFFIRKRGGVTDYSSLKSEQHTAQLHSNQIPEGRERYEKETDRQTDRQRRKKTREKNDAVENPY